MIVSQALKLGGLLLPLSSSNAISKDALTLDDLIDEAWNDLAKSLSVRKTAESAIRELRRVRQEASVPNWDGYGGRQIDARAYCQAIRFLQALPTTTPVPDVAVDPDGEVDVTWHFGSRNTFTVSIGPTGRLSYSGLYGISQSFGTEWLTTNEIPRTIVENLARLVQAAR